MQGNFTRNAHWRDTGRDARFFIFDASAMIPFVVFLFHISYLTLWIATGVMVFLLVLRHYGFTVAVFRRFFRSLFAGKRKSATPWWMA